MKRGIVIMALVVFITLSFIPGKEKTFCNPMNLNYRFQPSNAKSYREAADPVVRIYKNKYFLFASHSGGYWTSDDMMNWNFLPIKSLPIEDYAPDVITINDTTWYIASSAAKNHIYFTTDPFTDSWKVRDNTLPFAVWDPAFFRDDDGKVYLYWGCSDNESQPIRVVQLDGKMQPSTPPKTLITHNPKLYGWENPGEKNQIEKNGFNEGAWMTKYNNRYYLQYASPGTEFRTYADGVYTSDSPTGPFKYETYSPFSYKPGGFAGGAGHSSTFIDKYGNYWHISTMSISVRHIFERRLGLFPAYFDSDGVLRTLTAFGDYPTKMADHKIDFGKESLFTGWMLLSYKKKATSSSSLEDHLAGYAFDEDIRTWWSASSGNPGEWLTIELDDNSAINAIQINFADNDASLTPESKNLQYCYKIYSSNDNKSWQVIADKSNNTIDACHDYIELDKPVKAKYIKLENVRVPDGKFSVFDLRIFGKRDGRAPAEVTDFEIKRNESDTRHAVVKWESDNNATGYIVNYGTEINKLYTSVMVYEADSLMLTGLNKGVTYFFSIDSFNESGVSKGSRKIRN